MIDLDEFRLYKKDKHNWVIEQKHNVTKGIKAGTVTYKIVGYYVNLDQACTNLLEKMISDESSEKTIQSVQSLSDLIKVSRNRIMRVVKENCEKYSRLSEIEVV